MKEINSCFFDAVRNRRTYYSIGKEKIVSENKILEIVNNAVKYTPSSFNSQSSRAVVLLNENHEKLWEIVKNELKEILPKENFEQLKQKIENCFQSGYGTILYFEDIEAVEGLQQKFPLYKDNFPIWSNHSSAILQYIVWCALEIEGLGASLQHYNPLIDNAVKQEWKIPENHQLIAQMPFGNPLSSPDNKEFIPIKQRVSIFN